MPNTNFEPITNQKVETSTKRVLGAAFFGLITGGYIIKGFDFTMPNILSIVQRVDIEIAMLNYESSILLSVIISIGAALIAAAIAGFLARRKGILAGLLANSVSLLVAVVLLISAIVKGVDVLLGGMSVQLYTFLIFLLILLASIFGGLIGERYYSPYRDLDLGQGRLTVFGVSWAHYFWIFPFVFYPFFASTIMVIYAGTLSILVNFYFVFHPSLWLKIEWYLYLFIFPGLALLAGYVLLAAFVRFYGVMQYGQIESKGWKKFGQILLYGIGAPMLASAIATITAMVTHSLPRPVVGDWKIAVIIILVIHVISIISWGYFRMKRKPSNQDWEYDY